jgi:hypothetical protein
MGFFAATLLLGLWLLPKGPYMRKLYDLVNLKIREEDDINANSLGDAIAWAIRIEAEENEDNFMGWNNPLYFEEPFLRMLTEQIFPEGGLEVDPLAWRLAQFICSDMELYVDVINQVPLWFTLGYDTAANIGNISTAPVVTQAIVTNSASGKFWDATAITPRMLIRALKLYAEQKRKIDIFRGTKVNVDTITVSWKDLIETRTTSRQGQLLKHILLNTFMIYTGTPDVFDLIHSNFKTLGDNDLFHMYVDFNEFILFDTQKGWSDDLLEDFLYGRLFWGSLMENLITGDGDKHDLTAILADKWFGVSELVSYDDGSVSSTFNDAGSENLYGLSSLLLPADDETYLDRTIPYTSPTTQITSVEYMAQKMFSSDANSDYATLTYVSHGINNFRLASKNIMNIEGFMNWVMNKGFLNFGGKQTATPEVSEDPIDTEKEVEEEA